MGTQTWPASLQPQTFSASLKKIGLQWRSPFNGTAQVVDFNAERWVFSLTLPPKRRENSGQVEALLYQLAGGIERVRCWHFVRPQPLGTMRGTPVLASQATRGNTTLSLGGVSGGVNLLQYTQDLDNAYWSKTNITVLQNSIAAPDRTLTAEKIVETTAASVTHLFGKIITLPANTPHTFTVYLKAAERSRAVVYFGKSSSPFTRIGIDVNLSNGTSSAADNGSPASVVARTVTDVGGGWYRVRLSGTFDAGSTDGYVEVRTHDGSSTTYTGDGISGLYIWGTQLQTGSTVSDYEPGTTLKAGDLIGAGSQLFMVASDVNDSGTGAMTVSVINRVRATIGAASAVTWDAPTVDFILPAMQPGAAYRPAILEPVAFDLEEIW
jgi:hypothetical protein